MASPSQIPTSQEIAIEQNPSMVAVSTHPDPVSPHQSDSIDALFNTEKADVVEDSLTSERGTGLPMIPRGPSVVALPETPELGRVSTISRRILLLSITGWMRQGLVVATEASL